MDAKTFMGLFEASEECAPDMAGTVDIVREQLEGDMRCRAYDASGDGTLYQFDGLHFGCAYAEGTVRVREDGLVAVSVDSGIPVAPESESALRKLFLRYNDRFKVPGLAVRDGRMAFEPAPFDPKTSEYSVSFVMGASMSVIHNYAGVPLALEAGVKPWDLLDYDFDGFDDDDDDDGDGGLPLDEAAAPSGDDLMRALRHLVPGGIPATL